MTQQPVKTWFARMMRKPASGDTNLGNEFELENVNEYGKKTKSEEREERKKELNKEWIENAIARGLQNENNKNTNKNTGPRGDESGSNRGGRLFKSKKIGKAKAKKIRIKKIHAESRNSKLYHIRVN